MKWINESIWGQYGRELNIYYRPARQILITIDDPNAAEKAADFGKEIAGLSGAKVYAVYVIDISFLDSVPMDDPLIRDMFEQFEKTGLEATSYIEKTAKDAGLEAEYILLKGNPAKEILNFSEKQKIDMIVSGSIGKSGVEHFTLGSTSEKVVRHAKISGLVVRGIFDFVRFFNRSQKNLKIQVPASAPGKGCGKGRKILSQSSFICVKPPEKQEIKNVILKWDNKIMGEWD